MTEIRSRRRIYFAAALIWSIVLISLSLAPERDVEYFLPREFLRDAAHSAAYCLLAFLLCFYLRFRRSFLSIRMWAVPVAAFTLLFCFIWGSTNELLQFFTRDRTPDIFDVLYDLAGAFFGIILFKLYKQMSRARMRI